jgi:flagellin-like hook-associated protein FlgL
MFTRVTSIGTTLTRQAQLQQMQADLATLTGEVASNKKADPAQGLGVGVSVLYKLYGDVQQGDAIQNVGTMAGQRLETMQTAMTSVNSLLGDLATASIQASGAAASTAMPLLAVHARDTMATMTTLLNTQQNGQSLFGGVDSAGMPMQASDAANGPVATIRSMLTTAGPLTGVNVSGLLSQIDHVFTAQQSSTFRATGATAAATSDQYAFAYSLNGVTATVTSGAGVTATDSSEVVLGRLAANINAAVGSPVATISGTGNAATITVDAAKSTRGTLSFAATAAVTATGGLGITGSLTQTGTFSSHVAQSTASTDGFSFTYQLSSGGPLTLTSGTGTGTASAPEDASVALQRLADSINNTLGGSLTAGVATVSGTGTGAILSIDAAKASTGNQFSFATATALTATGSYNATPPTGVASPKYQGLFYNSASTSGDPASQIRIGAGQSLTYNLRGDNQGFKDGMHAMSLLSLLDAKDSHGVDLLDNDAKAAVRDAANNLLASAQSRLTAEAGELGVKQQRLQTISDIQNKAVAATVIQINKLEAPDYFVASDRVNALKIQLQATYSITATLSGLSLVNYLK